MGVGSGKWGWDMGVESKEGDGKGKIRSELQSCKGWVPTQIVFFKFHFFPLCFTCPTANFPVPIYIICDY